jgi:hypothetical protein
MLLGKPDPDLLRSPHLIGMDSKAYAHLQVSTRSNEADSIRNQQQAHSTFICMSPSSIRMSGPLRSKQGCWTCRLRKKKCDERRPLCSTCESLLITCYGFGPKPDWMNDGEKERAVASSLKEIVKHTSRRKGTTKFPKLRDSIIPIAPKSSNGSMKNASSGPESNSQHEVTPPSDQSREQGVKVLENGSNVSMLTLASSRDSNVE